MIPADPEILAPLTSQMPQPPVPPRPRAVPHLGHTALFGLLVLIAALLTGLLLSGFLPHIPFFRHESLTELQTDPRAIIPMEAAMYALASVLSYLLFPLLWRRPFFATLRWDRAAVRRSAAYLAGTGVVLSVAVQLLSNHLPIPKALPIDKFFQNSLGVWLIAVFGVTVAPFFEELAFRGFLLPSLANAWDSISGRAAARLSASAGGTLGSTSGMEDAPATPGDPPWSLPALVFGSVLSSIGFALLHADQLAHAWAPLSVLFCVSLVLCIVRVRTHSFAASAFVHACYNGTIFVLLFFGTDGFRHLDKLNR